MYKITLTKKDIVAFNQQVGEKGEFSNESSLDYALNIVKMKKSWLYELSHLVRSLLVDHVFRDGNKRTAALVFIYYCEINNKKFNSGKLLLMIKRIAKNNIQNTVKIARLIDNVICEKNK